MVNITFNKEKTGFYFGLSVFILLLIFPISHTNHAASLMSAVAALMIIWWISEAIPLGATSLVPLALLPLLGITAGSDTAREYFNSTILIFLGGFLMALAMQKWMLHKRISLLIIKILGSSSSGVLLGFMAASAFISMFISNIATTVMLFPIGLAFTSELEEEFGKELVRPLSTSIMLGIAYASSIGGIGTLVGTAPNLIFKRVYEMNFPDLPQISFASWLLFGIPIAVCMLIFTWLLFSRYLFKTSSSLKIQPALIEEQIKQLGKISYEEKSVLVVFIFTVILWLFRTPIDLEIFVIPGWSSLFPYSKMIDDGTIAILSGIILFILPAGKNRKADSRKILEIDILSQVPWEVILIFGGGFALAKGFSDSGLSILLGSILINLENVPPYVLIASISTALTFLTEVTSNTATSSALLPVIAAAAKANSIPPLILMLPATISASFAFMLPVGTPPNAVAYSSGKIKIQEMIKAGLIMNFAGIIIITVIFMLINSFFNLY